jgi:hypothetical protein
MCSGKHANWLVITYPSSRAILLAQLVPITTDPARASVLVLALYTGRQEVRFLSFTLFGSRTRSCTIGRDDFDGAPIDEQPVQNPPGQSLVSIIVLDDEKIFLGSICVSRCSLGCLPLTLLLYAHVVLDLVIMSLALNL